MYHCCFPVGRESIFGEDFDSVEETIVTGSV